MSCTLPKAYFNAHFRSNAKCVKQSLSLGTFLFILLNLLSGAAQAQTFQMRTVVQDFVTTEWTLECPDGEVLDMTNVDLTDEGIRRLIECLSQIEADAGVHIKGNTVVRDFVVVSDEIISTTNMNVGPNQDVLLADPAFAHEFGAFGCGPWPFSESVRLHSLGRKHMKSPPNQLGPGGGQARQAGAVVITHLELGLPLRVPVMPQGFGN